MAAVLAPPGGNAADWRDCRAIADDAARLACYDRLASEAAGAPESGPVDDVAARADAAQSPSPAGPPPTPEDLFGRDAVAAEQIVRETAGIGRLDAMTGRVAELRRDPEGNLLLTLEGGQVWRQVDGPAPRLAIGDDIRIRRAAFGSYLLAAPGTTRTFRVRRLR
jgi:hypothetical protein